MISIHLGFI